jgi:hypothetical protein
MRVAHLYLVPGLAIGAAAVGIGLSAPAGADCTYGGGATVCAQGEVRGGGGAPSGAMPYYPYPCEDDWLCDDGGISVIVDPSPPIDIGRPGRPGIGPRR